MRKMFAKASKNLFMLDSLPMAQAARPASHHGLLLDHLGASSGGLDLLQRGLREQVRLHQQRPRHVAGTQPFQAVAELLDDAQLDQNCGRELVAFQRAKASHVDDRVFLLEDVREPTLGKAAVQRHLAALEPALLPETGDRLLALLPAAGGLAAPAAHAAAHAPLLVLLPRR